MGRVELLRGKFEPGRLGDEIGRNAAFQVKEPSGLEALTSRRASDQHNLSVELGGHDSTPSAGSSE